MNLDTLQLPGKEHPKEALPALYEQLLRDHGIRTKAQIAALREKYDLHMRVEKYISADMPESENKFIRE